MEADTIYFYRKNEPFGEFSNFYASPLKLKDKMWPTTEHYFQAQKFADTDKEETIRIVKSPMDAFHLGNERNEKYPLRKDWETVKDSIMAEALLAKFSQHENLKKVLLSTKSAKLLEKTTGDYYWGIGTKGTGKNMLGILLMELRDKFQKEESDKLSKEKIPE